MPLPYLTCSMRTVLLLYNQSVVMLLYLINSVGPQIAKKLLRLNQWWQWVWSVIQANWKDRWSISLICMCFWFYTFHFRADNAVTAVYKPPNTTLFGKALEMKLKVASGRTQWFKGQISNYDVLTGKYSINTVSKQTSCPYCLDTHTQFFHYMGYYWHHCYPIPPVLWAFVCT